MTETEQTRANPEIGREIATTADGIDITRGYTGPLLRSMDTVLQRRSGGDLQLYEAVLSDPQVKSVLAQRQLAVTKCEWQVDAASDRRPDKKAADSLRAQLNHIGWDRVTTKMLFGVFYGYAVAEVIYARDGAQVVMDQVKVRNRRRFRFGKDGDLRLLTQEHMLEGIPAEAPYFWHYSTGADHDDEPYGLGLAHWLYWPVLFKRNGLKFWLIFLEKFGMPTAKGVYDTNATPAERQQLLAATRAIQSDAGIIVPKGMVLELLEAARSGTADYKSLHDTMDDTIAKVVVGQTASSQGTAGKLGNEELQSDVRQDLVKADADLICESFNRGPVRWLTQWNFPGAEPPRVYRVVEEPEDLQARAERDKLITEIGFKPTLAYIEETYGGEWTESKSPPPAVDPAVPGDDPAAFAESGAAQADPPERQADQLDDALQPHTDAWLNAIRALVERADSLEQVRDGLLELMPDMKLDDYTAAMRQALAAAALAGRYEITQEAGG